MLTTRHTRAALAFAVATLISTGARATIFDFGFTGNGTAVSAELNANLIAPNTYQITSYILPSFVTSEATFPSRSYISGPSGSGAGINTFQYVSSSNFSISNGIGFSTSAGTFKITPTSMEGVYALQSSVPGANTSGSFTLFGSNPAVLGTPGPIAGAGLVPLFGLAAAWLFGCRKRLAA